uniref:Uncharacterized protein n=1 Tax=Acrobeloides nanus TaxID=290746 RepID=A0A914DD38_9BILA
MLIKFSLFFLASQFLFSDRCVAERCPIIFGDSECPKGYNCVLSACKDSNDQPPPNDCDKIECDPKTRCFQGRCYFLEGLPCGRNVLVAQNTAKSFVSDCGPKGVCLNGRCVTDKCADIECPEGEQCRDGNCAKLKGTFCWNSFDCGIGFRCEQHQCINSGELSTAPIKENCDPGEVLIEHQCKSAGPGFHFNTISS